METKGGSISEIDRMRFSVLICTYNHHELLERCLHALIIEETTEKPDQVVVVNGGDERADKVVQSFLSQSQIEIKLIKTINRNLATSRNVGLAHCAGDIIAMTDDDARVFPDWVTQMKRVHQEHPEAGAVGGPVLGLNSNSLISKVADVITFPNWSSARYVRTLPGVNISYKLDVVERVGTQDENLFRGEDVDYNWRVLESGQKIYFDPLIKVYHFHRPTMKSLLHQHYMYGRAYYLVRRKWPTMYCVYPHSIGSLKDFLKGIHVILALFYQPFLNAIRLENRGERLISLPLFFLLGLAWKSGMVVQAIKVKKCAS